MNDRLGWDDYFLQIAETVSLRADCKRRKVGSVIVDEDHRIVSTGYNGTKSGNTGCLDGGCPRGNLSYEELEGLVTSYDDPNSPGFCISTHSEMNAIYNASRKIENATIYITDPPCLRCEKELYNHPGIERVIHA